MEERKRILEMLEQGKIDAKQAEGLLESIEKKVGREKSPAKVRAKGRKLRVVVQSKEEGGENVNISIPLSLAKLVTKFIPKDKRESMKSSGIDVGEILGHIDELEGLDEDIVNVDSGDEKVRIYIQ
jgi:hypothetical protein